MLRNISAWLCLLLFPLDGFAQSTETPSGYFFNANSPMGISASVDLLHPASFDNDENNRLIVRDAELSLFGSIDHLFDGVLTLTGHSEYEGFHFEVHEAYIGSSKLIPRSRFRIGKFLLAVGRLNPFHRHDWPFITAPKIQREFFNSGHTAYDAEGAIDTGIEYSILLPLPFYFDLTLGVTNGYEFGHSHAGAHDHDEHDHDHEHYHAAHKRPQSPLYYVRPTFYFALADDSGLLLGLNYLNHKDHAGVEMALTGLDATYKKREGRRLKWLFQSEIWHRAMNQTPNGDTSTIGAYIYPQFGWSEKIFFGLRLDAYSRLNGSHEGEDKKNLDYAFAPVFTYKPSEFSHLRVAYTHEVETVEGSDDRTDRRLEFQFVYFLGAHPAHDF